MKNKLTKTISGVLASLLVLGSSMSYASSDNVNFRLPQSVSGNEDKRAEIKAALYKINNFVGVWTSYKVFFCNKLQNDPSKLQKIVDIIDKLRGILGCSLKEFNIYCGDQVSAGMLVFTTDQLMALLCSKLVWGYLYKDDVVNKMYHSAGFNYSFCDGADSLNIAVASLAFAQTEAKEHRPDEKKLQDVIKCINILKRDLLPMCSRNNIKKSIYNNPNCSEILLGLQTIAVDEEAFSWDTSGGNMINFYDTFNNLLEFVGSLYVELKAMGYSNKDLSGLSIKYKGKGITLKKYFENVLRDDGHLTVSRWPFLDREGCINSLNISFTISKNWRHRKKFTYEFKYTGSGFRLRFLRSRPV